MELYTLHLFAGAGGGILGDMLLGHRPVGAVEIEKYPRKVLLQRQIDGILPRFPIWDDVCTFRIDNPDCTDYIQRLQSIRDNLCICGGFPCTDISAAGKGAGITGPQSGLWKEYARIVCEIRPRYVFVENSPILTSRGLGTVLGDLAAMGYDGGWGVFSAADVGARHERSRIWIMGYSKCGIRSTRTDRGVLSENYGTKGNFRYSEIRSKDRLLSEMGSESSSVPYYHEPPSPESMRVVDDVAFELDMLKAIGNGQVPRVAKLAWDQLIPFLRQTGDN